jgi:heme/copper-type cytochrome/quinol oxidase subunit 1
VLKIRHITKPKKISLYFKRHSMRLKQRPYNLLLLTSILLFIVGLFSFNSAMDIHLHDTYFVFPLTYLMWIPSVILLIFWLLYLLTKKFLYSKALIWTHIISTIVGSVFILAFPFLLTNSHEGLAGIPSRYYDIGQSKTYQFFGNLTKTTVVIAFILTAGQLTYLINFVVGLYKRPGAQNNR